MYSGEAIARKMARLTRFLRAAVADVALVAEIATELTAAMIGAELGLPVDHLDDHASYLASWLKVLKTDSRAILTAAGGTVTASGGGASSALRSLCDARQAASVAMKNGRGTVSTVVPSRLERPAAKARSSLQSSAS